MARHSTMQRIEGDLERKNRPVKLVVLFFFLRRWLLLLLMRVKVKVMRIISRRKRTVELEKFLKLTDELPKHGQLFHAPDSDLNFDPTQTLSLTQSTPQKNPHPLSLQFSQLLSISLSLSLLWLPSSPTRLFPRQLARYHHFLLFFLPARYFVLVIIPSDIYGHLNMTFPKYPPLFPYCLNCPSLWFASPMVLFFLFKKKIIITKIY